MLNNVYLNGQFTALAEAKVSVMDRGFLLSDGVYEVIPIYNSKPIAIERHYARLTNSMLSIGIKSCLTLDEFGAIVFNLISTNEVPKSCNCYFQVTRGVGSARRQFEDNLIPTVFAGLEPHQVSAIQNHYVKAITVEDIRWDRCDIKGINRLANVMMVREVYLAKVHEGIICYKGNAIEGISSNLFIVYNGVIITQPLSNKILGGITRQIIIDLIHKLNLPFKESNITVEMLFSASEVWLTSSVIEVAVVSSINGTQIVNDHASLIASIIYNAYKEYIDNLQHE